MMRLLKRLLPWHVRKTMVFARNSYARRKPPFSGVYSSFSAIRKSGGYDDASWTHSSLNAALESRRRMSARVPELPPSKWLLPMLVQSMKAPVRILDFGGASGLDYGNLRSMIGDSRKISYHVVDMEGACSAGRDAWNDYPNVTFGTNLPDNNSSFDIVYAYSSIQYVEDFRSLLRRFAEYRPKAILLCKHPIHFGQTFARCQVSMGAGLELAQWALSLDDIEKIFAECGYVLSFRVWSEDSYNVDNYDEAHKVERAANLLFGPKDM